MFNRFLAIRIFLLISMCALTTDSNLAVARMNNDVALDATLSFTQIVPQTESPLLVRIKKKKEKSDKKSRHSKLKKSHGRSRKGLEQRSKDVVKKKTVEDQEKDIFQWFSTYAEVVSLVQKKGFKTVDFSKFIQSSLKSAVANIDAHSAFFDQESYKAALEATSGEFSGIGVSIISKTPDDDALVVVDVIQGGPADKAGLKGGDKIVEVNKEKLRGLSSDEVVNKLKGKLGTVVDLKVIRNRKPLEFTVKRDVIKDQTSICYYFKDQNVYYLSLSLFTENASIQMSDLLKKANEGKCSGIVLDLRRNPGGTLDSTIDMAGLFLPKGSLVVVTKDSKRRTVARYFTKSEPMLKCDVPIFILVNNLTASAAEILAGCLAYHSRSGVQIVGKKGHKKTRHNLMVFVVGTSTFGKGSVQELIPIKNGCALKLTTMLYFLPKETSLQATGIQPDFTIKPKLVPVDEMKWIAEFYGKESALKNHISVKEVEEIYSIKPSKEAEKEAEALKKAASSLEDIVEFSENDRMRGSDVMSRGERDLSRSADKKNKEKSWEEKRREDLALDVQVQACVNMVSIFNLARQVAPGLVATRQKAFECIKQRYLTDEPAKVERVM
jgi:carboxyl-terminal processing protease